MSRRLFPRRPAHARPAYKSRYLVPLLTVLVVLLGTGGAAYAYWTLHATGTAQVQAQSLAAPTGLGLTGSPTATDVALTWAVSPAPAAGYVVERCTGTGCTAFAPVTAGGCAGTVALALPHCTDTSLSPGTTYRFAVVAIDHQWHSGQSTVVTASTTGPGLTANPASGTVGEVGVALSGAGFVPNKAVTATFGGVPLVLSPVSPAIQPTGTWSATFTVPTTAAGAHLIAASQTGGSTASTSFTVVPAITLSASSGSPGTVVTVTGTGFGASSSLAFTFTEGVTTTTLQPAVCVPSGSPTSSATGTLPTGTACTVTIPPTAPAGSATVTVTDASSHAASAPFLVLGDRLVFTSAAVSGAASTSPNLGTITVQRQTGSGVALHTSAPLTVTLASTTGGVFGTSQFGTAVTQVTIPSGSSSTTFWYGDTATGTPTITGSASTFTSATQKETITTAPAGLELTTIQAGGGGGGHGNAYALNSASGAFSLQCGRPISLVTTCTGTIPKNGTYTAKVEFADATGNAVVYSATQQSTVSASTAHGHKTQGFPLTVYAGASTSATAFSDSAPGTSGASLVISFGPYTLTITLTSPK